ncbi:unnamed protein product, partial [Meganyctiphanes norvegica]
WCPVMVFLAIFHVVLALVMVLQGLVDAGMPAAGGRMIRIRKDGSTVQQCLTSGDCGPDECCVQSRFTRTLTFCYPMKDLGHQCSPRMQILMGKSEIFIGGCPCKAGLACEMSSSDSFCVPYG